MYPTLEILAFVLFLFLPILLATCCFKKNLLATCCYYCKKKQPQDQHSVNLVFSSVSSLVSPAVVNRISMSEVAVLGSPAVVNEISMSVLATATNNFSSDFLVGEGSFGQVYKGQLSTGVTIAVKKLRLDAHLGFREFRSEVETSYTLQHPNLIRVLCYCVSAADRALVYEFKENGSLDQWLCASSSSVRQPLLLTWNIRVKIIRGVACGLSYLHGLEKPIIHRDIKPSNVLLDLDFNAYISDFGLARRVVPPYSHVSTDAAGSIGYMPPECREGSRVATKKGDVYSFGILMLEVATGRKPTSVTFSNGTRTSLVEWARELMENYRHIEMVDPAIRTEGSAMVLEIEEYFKIAFLCISSSLNQRISMTEVVDMLDRIQHESSISRST